MDTNAQLGGAFLQKLLDAIPEPIFYKDTDGVYRLCNRAFEEFFSASKGQIVGKTAYDLPTAAGGDAPRDALTHREMDDALFASPGVQTYESSVRHADGTFHDVMFSKATVSRADGRVEGLVGVMLDITRRKQAERAFRRQEEKYRQLVEGINDIIYSVDGRGVITYVSPAAEALTGHAVSEIIGRPFMDFVHPDDRDRVQQAAAEAYAGRGEQHGEHRLISKSGEFRWFRASSRMLPPEGPVTEIRGVLTDITEQKRAEEALRRANERLQYIIDNTHDVIFEIDPEGNYTFGNRAAERITGYRLDEVIGMNMRILVAPEYHEQVFRRLEKRLAGEALEQPFRFEIVRKDGRRVPLELTTSPVRREGKLVAVQGIARDVSERERSERALRESEERLRAIVSSLHETVILLYGPEGAILDIWAPAAMEERYQLRADEMRGRRIEELLPAPLARERLARIREVFRGRRAARDEYRLTILGRELWAEVGYSPMLDASGEVAAVVGFLRDVTERKQAEDALRIAHGKLLNAREQERRRMAAELHDAVGQSLIALQLSVKQTLAAGGAGLDAAQAKRLAELGERCGAVVREVRQICHGLYPPILDSLGLVPSLRQLLRPCQAANVIAEVHCCEPLQAARLAAEVEIALFRIAQEAVNNVLRHAEARRLDVHLDYADGEIVLRILDDGLGFDVASASGSGLGLSSMRERAQAIGGRLKITSSRGGTCVEVAAPAAIEP
jgi:PAS domain S-box-containing protein